MTKKFFLATVLIGLLSSPTWAEALTVEQFREGQRLNAIRAQYHRWFQLFEREFSEERLKTHLELLAEDVTIRHYGGTVKGHSGMRSFISAVRNWKNSHKVEKVWLSDVENGTQNMEADIIYQNVQTGGYQSRNRLHYSTTLEWPSGGLPIFKSISLLPTDGLGLEPYEEAFPENRALSFLYYWLTLADNYLDQLDWSSVVTDQSQCYIDPHTTVACFEWLQARDNPGENLWHQLISTNWSLSAENLKLSAEVQVWSLIDDEVLASERQHWTWTLHYLGDEAFAQAIVFEKN